MDWIRRLFGAPPAEAPKPTPDPVVPPPSVAETVAQEFQRQAKERDDEHKARIREHVTSAPPPLTPEGKAAIEVGRSARLAIKHVFPPKTPLRSMSYVGGLPIVPPDFDWPTVHNRRGLLERLTFVAQIDCADLPPGPGRHLLPERGFLYFFAPLSDTFGPDALHFVTRYVAGKPNKRWEPLDMPFSSKLPPKNAMEEAWRGPRTHFDKAEITFGWIAEPTDEEVEARSSEGHPHEVAPKIVAEREAAFFGPPRERDPLLSPSRKRDAPWTPYPGFPANWYTARILRRLLEVRHRQESLDVAERLKALAAAPADDPEKARLRALQIAINGFGSRLTHAFFPTINSNHKDVDAPPDAVKEQILAFVETIRVEGMPTSRERTGLERVPHILNDWLAFAAVHGAERALTDADGAALIPPEVVGALAGRHRARKHQIFGEGEVVQVEADDRKDAYLLLFQLGPDPAMDWTIGEMGPLQYWITPEDLAARRFEKTVLTIEAY